MKAERRHELKTNTLAQGITGLPAFWAQHGNKVLLAVIAVLAVVLLMRYQASSARQAQEAATESYAAALSAIDSLRNLPGVRDPKLALEQRRQIREQADAALGQVLDSTKDETLRANALMAQGDLNWYLARTPLPPGAATQPAAQDSETKDQLLDKAKRAYEAAAKSAGAKQVTVAQARFAIAAIAEEQGKWDEAAAAYDLITKDPNALPAIKFDAQDRRGTLDKLKTPALVGKPQTLPAIPAIDPLSPEAQLPLGPLGPVAPTTATAPTTAPAEAASQPATLPVEK